MDFAFSEEQTLLRNSLSRYLADKYAYENWRKFTRAGDGRDPVHWRQFAEMGLFAAPLPETYGGLGGGVLESLVVMEEFGPRPGGRAFRAHGGDRRRSSGERRWRAGRGMAAQDCGRRDRDGVRFRGGARPLQPGRPRHHGEKSRATVMSCKAKNPSCWRRPGPIS